MTIYLETLDGKRHVAALFGSSLDRLIEYAGIYGYVKITKPDNSKIEVPLKDLKIFSVNAEPIEWAHNTVKDPRRSTDAPPTL